MVKVSWNDGLDKQLTAMVRMKQAYKDIADVLNAGNPNLKLTEKDCRERYDNHLSTSSSLRSTFTAGQQEILRNFLKTAQSAIQGRAAMEIATEFKRLAAETGQQDEHQVKNEDKAKEEHGAGQAKGGNASGGKAMKSAAAVKKAKKGAITNANHATPSPPVSPPSTKRGKAAPGTTPKKPAVSTQGPSSTATAKKNTVTVRDESDESMGCGKVYHVRCLVKNEFPDGDVNTIMDLTESISHSLSDIRSKKTSRHLSQIAAVEKEIAALTAKHVDVFNRLEDALERKETKSEYVAVAVAVGDVKAEIVGEGVKKLVETAHRAPRMEQVDEDEWDQRSSSHAHTHAFADVDEDDRDTAFFDNEPVVEKVNSSPLRLGAITNHNHASSTLPTPSTATATATANNTTTTAIDNLRTEAASLTTALKSRREHLTHLRTRFAASTARLERLERDLTTISGRWEEEERGRVQAGDKRKRTSKDHDHDHDHDDDDDDERSTRKKVMIAEVAKGAALVGLGVAASLGLGLGASGYAHDYSSFVCDYVSANLSGSVIGRFA
ncbi:hypothetical protein YB2330_001326 [Saitoella coloradoensis]